MVILIDVVKTSNIINHPLVRRKIFKQINFFFKFFLIISASQLTFKHIYQTIEHTLLNYEIVKAFSLRSDMRKEHPLSPLLLNIVLRAMQYGKNKK